MVQDHPIVKAGQRLDLLTRVGPLQLAHGREAVITNSPGETCDSGFVALEEPSELGNAGARFRLSRAPC
jgi:hypothetical protein